MNLLKIQKRFINNKPNECSILKGKSNSGKSYVMMHKILQTVNNYAFEDEDKILIVQKEENIREKLQNRYEQFKKENEFLYMSLLSSEREPEFLTIHDIVNKICPSGEEPKLKDRLKIIGEILENSNYKKCKKLTLENAGLLINEIRYIKNKEVKTLEEFMTLMGSPLKLRKNSKAREDFFDFYRKYNKKLNENNLMEYEDKLQKCIDMVQNGKANKYVHVFVDNVENLSSLELKLLLSLYKRKTYGSITLAIDVDKGENIYSDLVKKGRVYAKKVFGNNKKIFNFKYSLKEKEEAKVTFMEKVRDNYKYLDLKHGRQSRFSLEDNGHEILFVDEDNERYKKEDLKSVPVFNNIAAGEPILINPSMEDIFSLPDYYLKGAGEKFILKVKGDSMINADINDGDYVVIEQNPSPLNGNIVAVNIDGSATLKRLQVEKSRVLLLPENEKYDPIVVNSDQEFFVLGVAVGVIKKYI